MLKEKKSLLFWHQEKVKVFRQPIYSLSDTSGLRSLLITSESILLHSAAYGLRSAACCRANSLPSAAAFSKSALASSFWHANLRKRPLCTSAWQADRPSVPPREMAWSRSRRAPGRRREDCHAHTTSIKRFHNADSALLKVFKDVLLATDSVTL